MLMEDRRWWFYSTVDEAELHDAAYAVNHCECQNVDGTRSHVGLRPQRHDADNTGNERPGWEGALAPPCRFWISSRNNTQIPVHHR